MEKSLSLLFFLCSALMEAQCLECYVCGNCAKVKLDEIQTCGPTITLGSSTITSLTTESATTTRVTNVPNISTSTTSEPTATLTTTTLDAATTFSIITTEATTTSTKATDAIATMTETGSTSTESDITLITTLSTSTMAPTYSSMTFTENPMNTSVNIPISSSTSSMITTISDNSTMSSTELPSTVITAAPNITTTVTEGVSSSTESADLTSAFTEVSRPVISSLTTSATKATPPDADYLFISTTTAAVPFTIPTTEFTSQNVPASSNPLMAKPVATMTPETGPDMPFVSAANYPVSAVGVARPGKEINGANNFRANTASSEDCACKGEPTCDCASIRQRTKRYALRGLGLSKEGVKYVCVIDKYQVNGTEFVKRGCAIKEEDEQTSCSRSGFGIECKTCDTNQCNSAAITQSSIVLIFSVYLLV